MTAVPHEAVMANLRAADSVRLTRARLHREIAALPRPAGCRRVSDLLEDPPRTLGTLEVFDLLRWIHRVGKSQARGILVYADQVGGPISEWRRVGELSERQRYALADHLYDASTGCTHLPYGGPRSCS